MSGLRDGFRNGGDWRGRPQVKVDLLVKKAVLVADDKAVEPVILWVGHQETLGMRVFRRFENQLCDVRVAGAQRLAQGSRRPFSASQSRLGGGGTPKLPARVIEQNYRSRAGLQRRVSAMGRNRSLVKPSL